uniref:Uncharacterized protein n=1 Tax=Glossina brevipalpis TaxID=37001 RepID=A0A1A9WLS3_9MUSC
MVALELVAIEADCGGGGGGLDGGGGDFMAVARAFIRDEIDEDEIVEEDVVDALPIVLLVALVFRTPLSKGFIRSCGSKLVTVSKTLEEGLLLELTLPAVKVEVDDVSERASKVIEASPPTVEVGADVLPEANENCLPKKLLPALVMPPTLILPIPLVLVLPDSLAVLPRFLLANSYMSPNMPANVFLKFFIVSSASSTTELCDCGVCESRRIRLPVDGGTPVGAAAAAAVVSSGTSEILLRLVSRPIEPTAGEVRSGIGGGPPIGAGRGPAGAGGRIPDSSVGLPVSDDTDDRAIRQLVAALMYKTYKFQCEMGIIKVKEVNLKN